MKLPQRRRDIEKEEQEMPATKLSGLSAYFSQPLCAFVSLWQA